MENVREWLAAFSTPIIAVLGLWIAYQQFRFQRYQFRHDLSEKRLAVFFAVRELLFTGVTKRQPPIGAVDKFNLDCANAPFLFGPDVNAYLHELQNKYLAIWNISEQQAEEGFANAQERQDNLETRRQLRQWMREQLPRSQDVFRKYLDLSSA